jgi:uncharacterized protein YneF (UPF0154 family)
MINEHISIIMFFIGIIHGLMLGYSIGSYLTSRYFKKELQKIVDKYGDKT